MLKACAAEKEKINKWQQLYSILQLSLSSCIAGDLDVSCLFHRGSRNEETNGLPLLMQLWKTKRKRHSGNGLAAIRRISGYFDQRGRRLIPHISVLRLQWVSTWRPRQFSHHFVHNNSFSSMKIFLFWNQLHRSLFLRAPSRNSRQVISWINEGIVYWGIYELLCLDELSINMFQNAE